MRVCVWRLRLGGVIRGTRATTQCTVWISRCFLVSPGRFCESGMMCIVWRERFSGERRPVFIAGVRPSAMVMKAPPQPRSSARAVACRVLPPVFVYKPADVFALACILMCWRILPSSTQCLFCTVKQDSVVLCLIQYVQSLTLEAVLKRLMCNKE